MNSEEASSATLWMRAASGLEVLTGVGLIVAPSLLARLLFGSDLNRAAATGHISELVMVCLAAGCWPRAAGAENFRARAAHGSELARGDLPRRFRAHRRERGHPALARCRAPSDFGRSAYARLDGKPALDVRTLARFRGGTASRASGRLGKDQ